MAVRKVSNRSRHNVIGRFPSVKMRRMIQYESLVELDYIHLLEFDPAVSRYAEQPIKIPYRDYGKLRYYTPDFHVQKGGQNWLIECKSARFIETEDTKRNQSIADNWCPKNGYCYRVITDDEIRTGYRLTNAKFLIDYGRHNINSEIRARIIAILYTCKGSLTVGDLIHIIDAEHQDQVTIAIYHMAFHHEIEIATDDTPVSLESIVAL
jgi:hypothetical protein